MRSLWIGAATAAFLALTAGVAAADDDDHPRWKKFQDSPAHSQQHKGRWGDQDLRGGYRDDDRRHHDRHDGRHHDDSGHEKRRYSDDRGHWRDDDHREWRHADRRGDWRYEREARRWHAPPPGYYGGPPPRWRDDRVVYGAWFHDDYARIVTRYYGRPCYAYSGWRGDWRRPYAVGYILPRDFRYGPPPRDLYGRLPPAPYGYHYGSYDGDILLIADATRLVVDAILLSR